VIGTTVALTATALDAAGNALGQRPITWTTGAPTVVAVDAAGVVTAVGVGSALVFASAEGRLASATVTVTGIAPSSMTVAPTPATVIAGQSRDLVATLRDGTGAVITGRTVQWTSTNNTVAVVSSTGRVRGVAPGTVRIDANTDGVIGSATIVVVPVPIATIGVSLGSPSLLVGATTQATAVARDSVGGLLTGRAVVWSSSNPAVATVSAGGVVTAVALGTASIRATSEGVTGATSVSVVVGLPTTIAANSAITQTATVGTIVAAAPSVRVSDAGGTGVAGVTVTFAVASGGGSIAPSTVVTNASGIATLTSWTLGTTAGANTVTATATGLTGSPVLFAATGTAGVATQLALTTAPSGAVSGEVFAVQPVIAIHDANGNVVASSAPVTVTIATGTGVLAGTTTINAANGVATFTNLQLTGIGAYTLRFASAGLTSATTSTLNVTAGVPTQLAITTQPDGSSSGLAFITQPVVALRDAGGNQTTSTAAVTATIASGTGTLSGTTTVNAVNGVATFTNLALIGTGSHTLRFSATGLTSVVSNAIVIGAPTAIAANSVVTQSATVATDVAAPPSVRVTDAAGVGAVGVSVSFAVISGGGSITPSTVLTDANGVATLTQWTLGVTAGANVVRATVSGLSGSPVTFSATGTAGAPTQLAITRQPAGAVSGESFTTQPIVVVRDVHGNLTTSSAAVTVVVLTGTGTLSGTTTVNAVNGTVTFTDLALAGLGNHTLRFTSPGVSNATSSSFALVAGAPSQVVLTTQPGGASSGLVFATQPVVALRDATGNPTTSTATVTASIVTGTGTLGGTVAVAAVNGVATFTNLSITGSGAHTIRFAAPSMTSAVSNTVIVGAAANIAPNSATTQTAVAGDDVTTPPSVRVTDVGGQGVSGISVAFAVISGGGSISQATVVTDVGGFATLTSWTLGTTAGANSVRASVAGLSGNPVTFNATGVAGPATQLTITTQPNGAIAGVPFTTQPVIAIRDVNGNVTSSTAAVTASVASGNGAVSGTTTVNAVSGVATFTDLALTGGGNHTLRFAAPGLGNIVSATFVVGGATTIAANSVTTQSATAGANVSAPPSVLVTDAAAAPVSGVVVTFAVTAGGGAIAPSTVVTNASGIATLTSWTLGAAAGANTVTATAAGLTGSPVTFNATGTAGTATQLAITTQPSGASSAVAFTTQPVVAIRDANGNQTTSTAAVTAAIFSGTGTLTGTATVNAVSGVATFTNLVITGSGAHTIQFTSGALTNATSASFTVAASGATTIAANSVLTQSAIAGDAVGAAPSVLVTDAAAAPVAGVTVTFAVTAGGGAIAPSTVVTNASGIATLTSWTLGTVAGANTVTATAAGLTGSPVTFNATGTAGAATQLAITTQPSGASSAVAFTTQPVVAIRDANGNLTASTAAVTAAIFSGTGTLTGTATVNALSGVATFTDLVITGSGAHTIRFTSGALTNATSASFTVAASGATTIAANSVVTQSAIAGDAAGAAPSVLVTDAAAAPVAGVTVTFAVTAGGGAIAPSTVVTNASGIATLTSWTLGTVAGANTVTATAAGLTGSPVTFNATGTAGAATQLAITTQPSGASSAVAFTTQPVVAIRDANGNLTASTAAVTAAIFS
ncbi:MAG: Ig-like domain-containing protein, partial [Gemmatimonadaceae bacterium]|nr:Ig-like domain-containing protein [Gemmatimonadaceae bacterium]